MKVTISQFLLSGFRYIEVEEGAEEITRNSFFLDSGAVEAHGLRVMGESTRNSFFLDSDGCARGVVDVQDCLAIPSFWIPKPLVGDGDSRRLSQFLLSGFDSASGRGH